MSTKATKSEHKVVSRDEWIAARKKLLEAEKELTRRSGEKTSGAAVGSDCISAAPAALDRYPRGFTDHVVHPTRSIEQRTTSRGRKQIVPGIGRSTEPE